MLTGVTVMEEGIDIGALLPGIGKISMPGLLSRTAAFSDDTEDVGPLLDVLELPLLLLLPPLPVPEEEENFLGTVTESVSVKSKTIGDFLDSTAAAATAAAAAAAAAAACCCCCSVLAFLLFLAASLTSAAVGMLSLLGTRLN